MSLGESLLRLDLSNNELSHMEDGALSGVQHLLFFNISHNSLSRFNSDVFRGKLPPPRSFLCSFIYDV